MILQQFPPMGVYETLFRFADATHAYLGDTGTHPWAQGFPLTSPIPGGPDLPSSVSLDSDDLRYPTASGQLELRRAIARYYNTFYDAGISEDHIAVFAGGRAAILAVVSLLEPDVTVAIEETEYTPYYDLFRLLGKEPRIIPSHEGNRFRPGLADHDVPPAEGAGRSFLVKSNPCNPTGVTITGDALGGLVELSRRPGHGALIDEAYEFFNTPAPESVLRHIDDIDSTDIFVVGAATKGLQVPGLRVGWVVASRDHIELFRNYSSIVMGGVSRASQRYVTELLDVERVTKARTAISSFYAAQRDRYGEALEAMGFELFTGAGGFYHWGRLPGDWTADAFNQRLFRENGAILPGRLCDMRRRAEGASPFDRFARFSFGACPPDSFESDVTILRRCVEESATTV